MKEVVPDFQLGEIIRGVNDAGQLINEPLLGRTHEFPVTEEIATAMNMDLRTVGRTIKARAVRNNSTGPLLPSDVCITDPAGGMAGLGLIVGSGGLNDRQAYIVDPMIQANGVADKDIFYVITEGPVRVNTPAATAINGGDVVKAGAGGKVVVAALATDHGVTMGTSLETGATVSSALIDVHLEWN